MAGKYKHSFDSINFRNRWGINRWSRNCDWVIIGIHKWWCGSDLYSYQFCLLGFDMIIWIRRTRIESNNP